MAGFNRKNRIERAMLHGILITFSLVFIFPFLWMVCNSFKVQREMASSKFRLFPTSPQPVNISPYFDTEEFENITYLDGVDKRVWEKARPLIEQRIKARLESWQPRLPGGENPLEIPVEFKQDYFDAMSKGILYILSNQISDDAREAALEEHKRLHRKNAPSREPLPKALHPDAVEFGKQKIVDNAERLMDDELFEEVLDRIYRRFCLNRVKARIDYQIKIPASPHGWQVADGDATLTKRAFYNTDFKLAHIDYTKDNEAVFAYDLPSEYSDSIDRLYIGFRNDASWARISVEVIKNGDVYRTNEVINCHNQNWGELELRWDSEKIDPVERRTFFLLSKTDTRVQPENTLQVRLKLVKSNLPLAWYDKMMRNYRTVFREVPFTRYILTSLCICILNIVLSIFSCTLTAYAFARMEWPGRNIFFAIMLATMMLPGQVIMIPGFLINRYLGFYNSLVPLWLFSTFGSAFFIFLLRQFMLTIPKDLEDAARIDGCGFLGIYWHVIFPLIKPTTATIAIFTFTANWNNFMGPLIYVNDERLFPLALGLFKFNLISGSDVGLMMAGSFLMTLPIIILFFYAQKYFIQGITLTGTKG